MEYKKKIGCNHTERLHPDIKEGRYKDMGNEIYKDSNFIDDQEKMRDFEKLTKEEFLLLYDYLTEEEYENTLRIYLS